MNENFKPKEYEYSCMKCNENIVLESEEIEKGEFNCPECGEINKIDIKNEIGQQTSCRMDLYNSLHLMG